MITRKQMRFRIAISVLGSFFALLAALIFVPIPEPNREIFKTLLTFLGGAVVTIIGFYFTDSDRE